MPLPEAFAPDRVEAFSLTGYDLDEATGTVRLSYALDDLAMTEVLRLPPGRATGADDALVRLLWLAAAPSYYKAATPRHVTVAGGMTAAERLLLDALLGPGLGELYFVNGLDPVGPAVEAAALADRPVPGDLGLRRRSLVPVGGGKDSCVTIAALQAAGEEPLLASVRRFPVIDAVLERAGAPALHVERSLDPALLELNRRGARNGHVPVTAVVSLVLCLAAVRAGCDAVVMSNERSASEATRDWRGAAVNHQWSKSLAAEELIAGVVAAAVGAQLSWFSLLRPFSELAICRLFAERGRRFFDVFSSCNAAFRLDARRVDGWDRDCPKCRFVALALAPWLDRSEVVAIQGGDVLDDPSQIEGLAGLVEAGQPKPFECVGEVAESRVGVRLATEQPGWAGARALAAVAERLRAEGAWPDDADVAQALAPDLELAFLVPPAHRGVVEGLARAVAPR